MATTPNNVDMSGWQGWAAQFMGYAQAFDQQTAAKPEAAPAVATKPAAETPAAKPASIAAAVDTPTVDKDIKDKVRHAVPVIEDPKWAAPEKLLPRDAEQPAARDAGDYGTPVAPAAERPSIQRCNPA